MAIYVNSTEKQKKAQKVMNWKRRKAIRMGVRPKDFVTDHRPMVFNGRFSAD